MLDWASHQSGQLVVATSCILLYLPGNQAWQPLHVAMVGMVKVKVRAGGAFTGI